LIFLQKQVAKVENKAHTYKSGRNKKLPTDHSDSGVGFMYELFPARCMVSPNEVEETRVWTGYSNPTGVRYMKNKICLVS